jgi:hypothetical protein
LALPLDGAVGILDDEEDAALGGLAGNEADAGGVDDRDLAPRLRLLFEFEGTLGLGWKGRAIDESLGALLPDPETVADIEVIADAPSLISVSVFSSSSIGIVAFGSIGNLRSRHSLTNS